MSKGEERRRFPRSRRGVPIHAGDAGPGVLSHVDNVSANGVLCHTFKPIAQMTRMRLTFELPPPFEKRVDAEGVVVRCDPDREIPDQFKVAILFTRMGDDDHDMVKRYVEHDLTATQVAE